MKLPGILTSALLTCLCATMFAQIPRTISYQGILTDTVGTPKPDGTYSFTFRLYPVSTGGSPMWTEAKTLQVKHGLFQTLLGDQVVFTSSLTFAQPYWLGIQVANEPELSPRIALTTAGYSLHASRADTALQSLRADTARYAASTGSGLSGSGPSNTLAKWGSSPGTLGSSIITDLGTSLSVALGATGTLDVAGDLGSTPGQYLSQMSLRTPLSNGNLVRLSFGEGPDAKAQIEAARGQTASDGYLAFRTRENSATVGEVMRLTKDGFVGIGTSTPSSKLEIDGTEGARSVRLLSGPNAFLDITPTNSTNTVFSTVNNRNIILDPGTGNVGIGVPGPTARLQVSAGSGTPTATSAAAESENFTTLGEAAWFRTSSASNPASVLKLNRHPSSTGMFIEGINWDGVNTSVRRFHIDGSGTYVAGSDFAEAFEAVGGKAGFQPGDVVVLSDQGKQSVEKCATPNDTRVVGVYSTRPGVLGADKNGETRVDRQDIPVAITGIVPTKVSTENGPVRQGDLLTTSSRPGYAMKASPQTISGVEVYRPGTIVGKALEPLAAGDGLIRVLIVVR